MQNFFPDPSQLDSHQGITYLKKGKSNTIDKSQSTLTLYFGKEKRLNLFCIKHIAITMALALFYIIQLNPLI